MEYRRLGRSGLQLSVLSYGSWVTFHGQIEDKHADELMGIAYENGINFFDNAETYADGESEKMMGRVLRKKGWDEALGRLQLDYLDLYFCHCPDPNTPIDEVVWTMHNLITQGKILYWGTSQWSAAEIMEAHAAAQQYRLIGPTMEQPQYNMFERYKMELEYPPIFRNVGMGTTIFSPLAAGFLTGKYQGGIPAGSRLSMGGFEWLKKRWLQEDRIYKVEKLKTVAAKLDTALSSLAIAWTIANPNVTTAILGATKKAQLLENLKALDVLPRLTPDVLTEIENILQNKPHFDLA